MNSPYMGKFKVTQIQHSKHDGLDLVGIDDKGIHATISGVVQYAGWENDKNHSQGFGLYVCIKGADGKYYYYGHLSETKVTTGQIVGVTQIIGIEGNTGYSTGSHCHYCVRPAFCVGNAYSVSAISGIPNECGTYDDGYRPETPAEKAGRKIEIYIDGQRKYTGLLD